MKTGIIIACFMIMVVVLAFQLGRKTETEDQIKQNTEAGNVAWEEITDRRKCNADGGVWVFRSGKPGICAGPPTGGR